MSIEGSQGIFDSPNSSFLDVFRGYKPDSPITEDFLKKCKLQLNLVENEAIEYRRTILEHLKEDEMFVEKCSRAHAKPLIETDETLFVVEGIELGPHIVVLAQKIPQHTALK